MRAVVQRVSRAHVEVSGNIVGRIERGLLIFLGISGADTGDDGSWLARKIAGARVFDDDSGRMNRSVHDVEGAFLVISQFTLYGTLRKGTRPSWNRAAEPTHAVPLYENFLQQLRHLQAGPVQTGEFGAHMNIEAVHDGPVTLILDTRERDF